MYRKNKPSKTRLALNQSYEGETIEQKVQRITSNKEPIKDGARLIYTDRKDGVRPEMNIRTDRMELALDLAMTIQKTHIAKREERLGERTYDTLDEKQQKEFRDKYPTNKITLAHNKNSGAESTQGTDSN